MARVSTRENKNIYQLTRENLKLTRETASELLESIPPERIEKIENERSFPHPDEVLTMAEKYKKPDLCNYYCANQCPIGHGTAPLGHHTKKGSICKALRRRKYYGSSTRHGTNRILLQDKLFEVRRNCSIKKIKFSEIGSFNGKIA